MNVSLGDNGDFDGDLRIGINGDFYLNFDIGNKVIIYGNISLGEYGGACINGRTGVGHI